MYVSDFKLPKHFYPPDNSHEVAIQNWPELRAYTDIPKEGPLSTQMALNLIHGYHACVSYTDAQN